MQLPLQLRRKPDTHKGNYGHVLVLGGSAGLSGAVCLAAKAALRCGAGLVTAGVPKSLNSIFEIKLTECMSIPLKENNSALSLLCFGQVKKFLSKVRVIAIGPGAGRQLSTRRLILKIIKEVNKPIVADADALYALAMKPEILKARKVKNLVLTPHEGEFCRLVRVDKIKLKKQRKALAKEFALRYNLTLVLKGNRSLIAGNSKLVENPTGNPGMSTAGMGDVLTGVIAALIAQGLDNFTACRLGVYLHGLAGDFAARDKTQHCLIASDVIDYLPKAFKALGAPA